MNNITLTSTLAKDTTKYQIPAETLANLTFDPEGPAPIVKVSECYSSLGEKVYESSYEVSDTEPDPDLVASGAVWFLVGEANGNKVWLTLTGSGKNNEEMVEEDIYEEVEG
jgi:hypothetical protein